MRPLLAIIKDLSIFSQMYKNQERVSYLCAAKMEHRDRYICSIIEFNSRMEKVDIMKRQKKIYDTGSTAVSVQYATRVE